MHNISYNYHCQYLCKLNAFALLGVLVVVFTCQVFSEIPGEISVAMILRTTEGRKERIRVMGYKHAMDLLNNVFLPNHIAKRRHWPTIVTDFCEGVPVPKDAVSFNKAHRRGFQRGILLAHKQIWEDFDRLHRDVPPNISTFESPKIVIFEDDAMVIDPVVHQIGYEVIRNMTSDIHFLGHCYDRYPGVEVPDCTHAYVVTLKGCKILLENVDHCLRGGPIDIQFKAIARSKKINWTAESAAFPRGIDNKYIKENALKMGYTIEYFNQIGGLFYQARFDDILPIVDYRVYRPHWPYHKYLFVGMNGSLHKFPNLQTFTSLGYDFDEYPVYSMPHFQVVWMEKEPVPLLNNSYYANNRTI
jgi:hypothetical protein